MKEISLDTIFSSSLPTFRRKYDFDNFLESLKYQGALLGLRYEKLSCNHKYHTDYQKLFNIPELEVFADSSELARAKRIYTINYQSHAFKNAVGRFKDKWQIPFILAPWHNLDSLFSHKRNQEKRTFISTFEHVDYDKKAISGYLLSMEGKTYLSVKGFELTYPGKQNRVESNLRDIENYKQYVKGISVKSLSKNRDKDIPATIEARIKRAAMDVYNEKLNLKDIKALPVPFFFYPCVPCGSKNDCKTCKKLEDFLPKVIKENTWNSRPIEIQEPITYNRTIQSSEVMRDGLKAFIESLNLDKPENLKQLKTITIRLIQYMPRKKIGPILKTFVPS